MNQVSSSESKTKSWGNLGSQELMNAGEKNRVILNYTRVRERTEDLCSPLSAEDMLISATEDTSPPKWHLAHTTWFFDFFVLRQWAGDRSFDEVQARTFDFIFNSYYESLGSFLPKKDRRLLSRPSLEVIQSYRKDIDARVVDLISKSTESKIGELVRLIELGLNHEQQHQELLMMDIKQNYFLNPMKPAYQTVLRESHREAKVSPSQWISIEGGKVEIGTEDSTKFYYDNEGGRHSVWLEPFELANRLVTNGEYLEFIEAGGYREAKHWLSDGWQAVKTLGWTAPLYWMHDSQSVQVMGFNGVQKLDLSAPVEHLSYYEAQAFAHFKQCRLPTEFEWEHAATNSSLKNQFSQLEGDLWQWTQSAYLPYPRFKPFDNQLMEYNSKFMCNQMVLRGGCRETPSDHYRSTYRNFYYPHHRWQFSGLRLAR